MSFHEIMLEYFRGERVGALLYALPAGLLFVGLAVTALKAERGAFAWGLAIPTALVGVLLVGVGATIGLRTPGQVAALERAYAEDPAAMVAEELPRMRKVNANWPRLVGVWAGFVVIGLGLRFGARADWAHGVGPALVLIGACGLLIDGFAERRAIPYTAALEALAAEQGVALDPPA
ncbi:MAG: hypothetical protein KC486_35065 [Myxococcales bacterium]|nr:hypothetical protein [Myxococcales bacterium]